MRPTLSSIHSHLYCFLSVNVHVLRYWRWRFAVGIVTRTCVVLEDIKRIRLAEVSHEIWQYVGTVETCDYSLCYILYCLLIQLVDVDIVNKCCIGELASHVLKFHGLHCSYHL